MMNTTTIYATSAAPYPQNQAADLTLGVAYLLCFATGVPGNILAVIFFHGNSSGSKRKEFFRTLFLLIAYLNLITCLTLPPVVEVFFRDRDTLLFKQEWFCAAWGMLWEFIPFYSVFLLGVMSISRMMTLLLPLKDLSNKRVLLITLVIYLIYTVLVKAIPLAHPSIGYWYTVSAGFCYLGFWKTSGWALVYEKLYNVTNVVQLGAPFVPILMSCLSSIFLVYCRSQPTKKKGRALKAELRRKSTTQQLLENATVTIIVMTLVYIAFNIPVFVNYLYYITWQFSDVEYADFYSSTFLYRYLWNISYVLAMGGNAAANPAVYFWRVRAFRAWVCGLWKRKGTRYNLVTKSTSIRTSISIT